MRYLLFGFAGTVKEFREFLLAWKEVREQRIINDELQQARKVEQAIKKSKGKPGHHPDFPFKW